MDMEEKNGSLADLQAWMQHALVHPEDLSAAGDADRLVLPSGALSPRQRLAIYQRGYYARLVQCLEGQFKVLCSTLGPPLFQDFAGAYLRECPSVSPTLSDLGERFADYLQQTRPDRDAGEKEPWVDFMVDLARFEWDLYRVFDARGHEGEPYAGFSVPDARIGLQPCIFLREYRFPVSGYYTAVAQGKEADVPDPDRHFVAFCRKDYRIGIFTLLAPQFYFLSVLQQGAEVSVALGLTVEKFGANPEKARSAWHEWKNKWTEAGFFIDLGALSD